MDRLDVYFWIEADKLDAASRQLLTHGGHLAERLLHIEKRLGARLRCPPERRMGRSYGEYRLR